MAVFYLSSSHLSPGLWRTINSSKTSWCIPWWWAEDERVDNSFGCKNFKLFSQWNFLQEQGFQFSYMYAGLVKNENSPFQQRRRSIRKNLNWYNVRCCLFTQHKFSVYTCFYDWHMAFFLRDLGLPQIAWPRNLNLKKMNTFVSRSFGAFWPDALCAFTQQICI